MNKKAAIAIIIIILSLIAAAFFIYNKPGSDDITKLSKNLTRLTFSGDNSGHVWSPDGSKLFFQRSDMLSQESWGIVWDEKYIYMMDSDGSNQKKLAKGTGIALSPDGSNVFFIRNNSEYWVMNEDGSNLQKLSEVSANSIKDLDVQKNEAFSFIREYFWSPDQTKIILYTTSFLQGLNEYVSTLWMWDVKGGFVRKIISSRPLSKDYAVPIIVWSPDGKSFLFSFFDIVEGLPQVPIYNATVAYDERKLLTSLQGAVSMLDISPDGKNILYTHRTSTMWADGDIWVMNMDGSGKRQLTNSKGGEFGIWSPDGNRIAYISYSGDFGTFGDKNKKYRDSSKIWVMNADGSDKQLLLSIPFPHGIILGSFHWSPDGSKLAFEWTPNNVNLSRDIYLVNVPG